jgi:uncharacterized protein YcbK (DUF882 family)
MRTSHSQPFEVKTYQKGEDVQLSHNFHLSEFECECSNPTCTETKVDTQLVFLLQRLRDWLLTPVRITSAYRCEAHQMELEKAGLQTSRLSQHTLGKAADIWANGFTGPELEVEVRQVGFVAVGVAKTWVHVDTRFDKRRRWVYS